MKGFYKKELNKMIRYFLVIMSYVLILSCFSCSNVSSDMMNESEGEVEQSVVETEDIFVPESIDLSDVSGDVYRATLAKIDELNHKLGQLVYVTKDEYFKYKDVKVSIIGDSISDLSKTYLNRCFRNLTQDSVSGREMEKGIEAFDAMKELGRVGDIMILSLGNNAMKGIDVEVLEHIYEGIEGRPLIIPTIVMPYVGQERNRNRDLLNFIETHENCYVADWNKVARMDETFIIEDGVHPSGDGCAAYAQLMLKTVIDIVKESETE